MTDTPAQRRRLSLDALRGLAVLLMIEQHLGVWLWRGPDAGKSAFDYPVLVTFNALGGGAAPLFITLAGIGSSLMIAKRGAPDRTLVVRGLAVLGFGYVLSMLTPSWFTWRSWFVLHLMGFGIVLAPIFRRLPTGALLGLAASLLLATPFVQDWLGTPESLINPRMAGWLDRSGAAEGGIVAGGHLRLALAESQFPILPWLAAFVAGMATGRWIANDELRRIGFLAAACFGVGGAMAGLWQLRAESAQLDVLERAIRFNVPFFPASSSQVLLLMGVCTLAVWVALRIEGRRELRDDGWLVVLGRASLSLLLVHVVVFREWTRPVDLWQSLSPSASLAIMLGFIALAVVACRFWQRVGYRFGAEWLLRKVAP